MENAYTITREQCEQLDKEYDINNCLYYIMKARQYVNGDPTLSEAIDQLKKQTRFAEEVQSNYAKKFMQAFTCMDVNYTC